MKSVLLIFIVFILSFLKKPKVYTFKKEQLICPKCQWSGLGSELSYGDYHESTFIADFICPNDDCSVLKFNHFISKEVNIFIGLYSGLVF